MSVERSDVDVLAAIAGGDRQALRVLHDRHAPWLALRLARRCADPGVVDEALQDTFMAVWRSAGRYDGRGDVGAWIWGIAIRRLIDALRRLPRSEVLVAEVDDRRCIEDEVAARRRARRPRRRAVAALAGAARRRAGDRARRPHEPRGGTAARHPGGHREDADDARPRAAESGDRMTWHVAPELLARYADGEVDQVQAYSIEAHLPACEQCREDIAALVGDALVARSWEGIAAELDAPRPGPVAGRAHAPQGARRTSHGCSARRPRCGSRGCWRAPLVLGFAVWAAGQREHGEYWFLVLAPLLPLAGVAVAYGPDVDPTYEIGLAAPMRSFSLLLIRAVAVLATTSVMATVAGLALDGPHWSAAAWLAPSLG